MKRGGGVKAAVSAADSLRRVMAKKKPGMTPGEQSEKFREEAERLIAAGELNPIEAEDAMDKLVRVARNRDKSK